MTIVYSIIFALSLLLPVCYRSCVRDRQREPWLFVLFISVCVVNLGYLLLSVSKTVEFALLANKIAYFGQVFVPLCMFMIISRLSGFVYKKWVSYALIFSAMLMFATVMTTGHLDWYYKSVTIEWVDGAARLVKEYGFLHPVNLIYVLVYFVAMFVVIGISLRQGRGSSHKLAGLMLAVVIGNIGMWIVEKLRPLNFEFLSVSYLMSEFVFFFVYWLLQDYIHLSDVPRRSGERGTIIVVDSMTRAEKMESILSTLPEDATLSSRQMEILEMILDGKSRKEIAAELHLSENTVKTHTSMLYRVLDVSGRDEIYARFQK